MRSALSPPHTVCRGQALCLLLRGRLQGPKNATVALTTKPQGSLANAAKALTLKYSLASGPSLTHEIEPMRGKVGGLGRRTRPRTAADAGPPMHACGERAAPRGGVVGGALSMCHPCMFPASLVAAGTTDPYAARGTQSPPLLRMQADTLHGGDCAV